MLSHKIIKVKERVSNVVQMPHKPTPNLQITTSEQLQDYLAKRVPVGSFVCWMYSGAYVSNIGQCYYVLATQTDPEKLDYSYLGRPKTHLILNLWPSSRGLPYWENVEDMRPLSDDEIKTTVNTSDHVQDRIAQFKSERKE